MRAMEQKRFQRVRRKRRIRGDLLLTPQRPRLSIFRSLKQIYAQVIDDATGKTLCAASSRSKDLAPVIKGGGNKAAAKQVGKALALSLIHI